MARRVCYGIELDQRYVNLIIARFEQVTGTRPELVESDSGLGAHFFCRWPGRHGHFNETLFYQSQSILSDGD